MPKFCKVLWILALMASFLLSERAWADTCHVSDTSSGLVYGSLLHALSNQPGAGTGECDVIDFSVSGTIDISRQIHIGAGVTLNGLNKITLRPTASNFIQDVNDNCFIRIVNDPTSNKAIKGGSGSSELENIVIDAANRIGYAVCVYSNDNIISNVDVTGGSSDGLRVDTGIHNLITTSEFWDNGAYGIDLLNNGNQNILTPENVRIIKQATGDNYLILGTIDADTHNVEVFKVDTDGREGRYYKGSFLINSSGTKTLDLGSGKIAFAVKHQITALNGGGITLTSTDDVNNTSEFGHQSVSYDYTNIDECFSDPDLLSIYADHSNSNPCTYQLVTDCNDYDTCSDIADIPECATAHEQCCQTSAADESCPTQPPSTICIDEDNDKICDDEDQYINPSLANCQIYYDTFHDPDLSQAVKDSAAAAFLNCCSQTPHQNETVCQDMACLVNFAFALFIGYDRDFDGVPNDDDNCETAANGPCAGPNDQLDSDYDGSGDVCDNCPFDYNPEQEDTYGNPEIGDACEKGSKWEDWDNDGILNAYDNCVHEPNPDQEDMDGDVVFEDLDGDGERDDNEEVTGGGGGDACDFDIDGDCVSNPSDNCKTIPNGPCRTYNPSNPEIQIDTDGDGLGNVCDPVPFGGILYQDVDGDDVSNNIDNCIFVANGPREANVEGVGNQLDTDGNGIGDACQLDFLIQYSPDGETDTSAWVDTITAMYDLDNDGIYNGDDNCPLVPNPDQADQDGDLTGDVCEGMISSGDLDGDGVPDWDDNCIWVRNGPAEEEQGVPGQDADADGDGIGDACEYDMMTNLSNSPLADIDGDGAKNFGVEHPDNCPFLPNPLQLDRDNDGIGDDCDIDMTYLPPDDDLDGDGVLNGEDNCPALYNPDQANSDGDSLGDVCEQDWDFDLDGHFNWIDNCPLRANPEQIDSDGDGYGDLCDAASLDPSISGMGDGYSLEGGATLGKDGGCSLVVGSGHPAYSLICLMLALCSGLIFRRLRTF